MKTYFYLLFLFSVLLFSCSDSTSAQKPGKNVSKAPQGTLYLRTFYWAMNNTMEISWIYLASDGTIVRDPKHGTSPLNRLQEQQDNSSQVGTYKPVGND
ncbi:MAG TPA: hypothetical protein VFT06_01715, partial [Flavisolibacter sp.]|nr:hypothetical protein [Flavisolibacter sp.]